MGAQRWGSAQISCTDFSVLDFNHKEAETLVVKVNKINSHNSFSSYYKSLPLYRRQPNNRRKDISPGESGKISSKELDPETGFYYYGARYLDPRTSRWLSGDPAIGEYLPAAPVSDEAKKSNGNLPGQGGVFNLVNLHVYHYAGNNPVKYVDPDGEVIWVPAILIIAIALSVTSDRASPKPDVSTSVARVNNTLPTLGYGDPSNNGPAVKSQYQTEAKTSVLLESNPLESVGGGMPVGMPGPNDYDDGRTSTRGTIINSIGLVGDTIGNMSDGNGNFSGDVKMNIYSVNKKSISWDITETVATTHAGPITSTLTEKQAWGYLKTNDQYLKDSGIYNKINNALTE
jgi:RHS repeat-associated protein